MGANEIRKSDIGTQFTVTIKDGASVVDISAASGVADKQITFKKPGGDTLTKNAAFVNTGTDGKMKYTTVSGDLNKDGTWRLQGKVAIGGNSWSTDIHTFKVHKNLS